MTTCNPNFGNDIRLPTGTAERLAKFAKLTGTTPPEAILDADGAPTDDILDFARANGMSLDWLYFGDAMPLVMRAHNAAREGRV
ncbi:hypothetical protein [Cereibacter azotoformans]|uniref:Uncharacterized protein n=1 Tax=Cereibacter azotoformans TaxID=43057 RepID=A0A2T5JXS7_9RHOB|nr:hypothetical protein [Cereibacter azotoformans]MBO4169697.1 hypothetical protein [Cereibacter azotoformans]PTR14974.1 hypothetical protein C8J28_115119 [Cereibacter azotoformans]